jgi:hypothetical protein
VTASAVLFLFNVVETTAEVMDTVSRFYDELFDAVKARSASDETLKRVNEIIENGMTALVHNFSEYFDDDVKRFQAFTSLLESRKNEAIWREVFTFFFNFRDLSTVPPSLASSFVGRFWDCYYLVDREPEPYYAYRINKILYDRIYGCHRMDADGTEHYEDEYIKLFERFSREIAEKSSPERRAKILRTLKTMRQRIEGSGVRGPWSLAKFLFGRL